MNKINHCLLATTVALLSACNRIEEPDHVPPTEAAVVVSAAKQYVMTNGIERPTFVGARLGNNGIWIVELGTKASHITVFVQVSTNGEVVYYVGPR